MNKPLILGCGHPDRGDDAAGLLAARRLGGREIGNPLDLIDAWEGADEVVLIDAVVTGAPPGTITQWELAEILSACPFDPTPFRFSTHAFGIPQAIELARMLGCLPKRLTVWGIEAAQFEVGAPVSPAVLDAIAGLAIPPT